MMLGDESAEKVMKTIAGDTTYWDSFVPEVGVQPAYPQGIVC